MIFCGIDVYRMVTNMVHQEQEALAERDEFIEAWRQSEITLKRIAGVAMLFMAALILAFDQPVDQTTFLVVAALFAGGLALIFRRGRAEDTRARLYFLSQKQQSSRAMMAGFAGAALSYLAMQNDRPLFWFGVFIAVGFAAWFQWRVYKITQFTLRFKRDAAVTIEQESDELDEL